MHPILARSERTLLYLAAWILVGILLAIVPALGGGASWIAALVLTVPLAIVYAFLCLGSWYLCRSFPLNPGRTVQGLAVQAAAALISCAAWILLGRSWAFVLRDAPFAPEVQRRFAEAAPVFFLVGVLLYLLSAALHYLMMAFEVSKQTEANALRLQVMAREAELRALKAQVDPHFLFNSLNSIVALIGSDPAAARKMCIGLADFFRKSLSLAAQEQIPLEEEFALISTFLAIEKIRFGPRLRFEVILPDDVAGCLVPSLLLQPLVENAVKHGISGLIVGGVIQLQAGRQADCVRVSIQNPCDPETAGTRRRGVGLVNVRRRLETLYGSDARTDVTCSDGLFKVELQFPAAEHDHDRIRENGADAPSAPGKIEKVEP